MMLDLFEQLACMTVHSGDELDMVAVRTLILCHVFGTRHPFLEACIPGTIRWLMNELTKSSTRRDGESPESYGGLIKRKKHHGEAFDELSLSMENW
jgi:hypothetical protein